MKRILYKTTRDAKGCWVWQGKISSDGYAHIHFEGKDRRAHRVAYAERFGPIPADMQVDHVCRNRACVNPLHLELVTMLENVRRGWAARRIVCVHGNFVRCKQCINAQKRRSYAESRTQENRSYKWHPHTACTRTGDKKIRAESSASLASTAARSRRTHAIPAFVAGS